MNRSEVKMQTSTVSFTGKSKKTLNTIFGSKSQSVQVYYSASLFITQHMTGSLIGTCLIIQTQSDT